MKSDLKNLVQHVAYRIINGFYIATRNSTAKLRHFRTVISSFTATSVTFIAILPSALGHLISNATYSLIKITKFYRIQGINGKHVSCANQWTSSKFGTGYQY